MLKLAWRNLWRNKRRTMITAASVFFAVFFTILMRGFHMGTWDYLVDGVLHSYSGYIQLHSKGFWENKSFDYSVASQDTLFEQIKKIDGVKGLIPRIEAFSLASFNDKIKGVITVGINPEIEKCFSQLDKKIVKGRFFNSTDTGILLSQRLAKYLNIEVNDTLVLLSQGYQGASANGTFKVVGIVKLPAPEFDKQMVYMPLSVMQEFYSLQNRLTSVIVDISNPQVQQKIVKKISSMADLNKYEIMPWQEMLIELYQQRVSDEGGGIIMLALLYLIVGFGVFGTVLMMISERHHEFGIMVTVGMQRVRLVRLVGTELILICSFGLVSGIIGSIPVLAYFHFNPIQMSGSFADAYASFGMEPIMPMAWRADFVIQQMINVGIMVILTLFYPMYKMFKLDIVKAIRR